MVGKARDIVSYDYDTHPISKVLRDWFVKEIDDYNDDVIRMIISYKTFKNPSAKYIGIHLKRAISDIEMLNRNLKWEYEFSNYHKPLQIAKQIHYQDLSKSYHKRGNNMAIEYLGKNNIKIAECLSYDKWYSLDTFYKDIYRKDSDSYYKRNTKNSIMFNDRCVEVFNCKKNMRASYEISVEFMSVILDNTFFKELALKYEARNEDCRRWWDVGYILSNAHRIDCDSSESRKHLKLELYCYSKAKINDWYIKKIDDMKFLKFYNLKNITKIEDRHLVDILTYSIMVYFINNLNIMYYEKDSTLILLKSDEEHKTVRSFMKEEFLEANLVRNVDFNQLSFDTNINNGTPQDYGIKTITNLMCLNKVRDRLMKDLLVKVWNNLNDRFKKKHIYWDKLKDRMTLYMKEYRLKLLKDSIELVLPPYCEYQTEEYCFGIGEVLPGSLETKGSYDCQDTLEDREGIRFSKKFWDTYDWYIETKKHLTSQINNKFMSIDFEENGNKRLIVRQSYINQNVFSNNEKKLLEDISDFSFLHSHDRGYDNCIKCEKTRYTSLDEPQLEVKVPRINRLGIFSYGSKNYERDGSFRVSGRDGAKTINTKYINELLHEYNIECPKKTSLKEKVKLLYTDGFYQDMAKWKKQFKKTINRIPKIKTKLLKVRNCDKRHTNDIVVIHQSISSA